ncbi:hypothetical protein CAAN1_17S01552 [[Candida] anglica]|uniref:Zn(2)-C6 fungal-type domain-containing protein n=1 Tax=[Candida] anglica TaxID=148631 RepID=A0ABP0E801_9ASCO
MMTQLPSVFELMVGTRGRQQSESGASTAASVPATVAKDASSSAPWAIPRISSAASLPSVISSQGYARKSSVHSTPEEPSSVPSHPISARRLTEPSLYQPQGYQQQYPQQQHQQQPPPPPPAPSHHQQQHAQGPTSHPYYSQHQAQGVPPPPPGPSSGPVPGSGPINAHIHSQGQQQDYFPRQRPSISSSIDSLTRTNSTNGPLTLTATSAAGYTVQYSPKNHPHSHHVYAPPGSIQVQQMPGQPPLSYATDYFPQLIYTPVHPGQQPNSNPSAVQVTTPTGGATHIHGGAQVMYSPMYATSSAYSQHPQFAHYGQPHLSHHLHPHMMTQGSPPPHLLLNPHLHQHQGGHDENNALVNKRRIIKRRTRTGCLTCRKRRIKCDERKPHCFNCERSKKVCLGYENLSKKKSTQSSSPHSASDEDEDHAHDSEVQSLQH